MMNDRKYEFLRRNSIRQYLPKLSKLLGRKIGEEDLMPIEDTKSLSIKLKGISREHRSTALFDFIDFQKQWGSGFAKKLESSNPTPVVMFVSDALICGAITIGAISSFKCEFPFNLIPEGVITLATADGRDCATLDLIIDKSGQRKVEMELKGETWPRIDI